MKESPRLLAFDTAGSTCSAAVWADGQVVSRLSEAMVRGHSERLLPMIQAVMDEAGLSFESLDGLAVTTGPGAFTGIRIGLAAARGLALAAGLPTLGLSSFEAVAAAVRPEEARDRTIVVVLESKRADLYVQCFDAATLTAGPALSRTPACLDAALPPGPLLLAGDAAGAVAATLAEGGRNVEVATGAQSADAAVLARLAAARPLDEWDDRSLQPLYLRPPDVTRPRPLRGQHGPA